MRRLVAVLSAVALTGVIVGCDDNEETESTATPASAAAPNALVAADVLARFGGVLVQAQRFFVEVLPRADGQVEAHVYDAEGNEVTGSADAQVVVKLQGKDQQQHPVQLQWNAETKQYEGSVGAGVQVAPGRVEVAVEQEGEEAATGSVDTVAVAPEAQGGGTIVLAGGVSTEVRVDADGAVHAVVLDAEGNPIQGEANLDVTVNVETADDETKPVELAWNAEAGQYIGEVNGDVAPGPVEVTIVRNGHSHRGRVQRIAVAPTPHAGGRVVVAGDHSVELVPGDGKMQAILVDASGHPVTGSANAQLSLRIGAGTNARPLDLHWDAEAEKWVADLEGTVDLDVTPVEVAVVTDGRRQHGRFHRGLALGHARAATAGRLDVDLPAGGAGVRLDAPGVGVSGGGAHVRVGGPGGVQVRGPGGNVHVGGPGGVQVRGAGGANVRVGGGVSAMVKAGAGAEAQAAAARRQAEEARRQAAAARRQAEEARRQAAGASGSAMGGVSIMAGGSLNIGH